MKVSGTTKSYHTHENFNKSQAKWRPCWLLFAL